jgi:hypothetical protein
MSKTYYVTTNRNKQVRGLLSFKGETQTIKYDLSPWETDNGTVTAVTWTVKDGNAAIANESLASSIAQAEITTSDTGKAMVTLEITAGNNKMKQYLHVHTKDPYTVTHDYDLLFT